MTGLLITRLSRSVPASGARVKPVLRVPAMASIISGVSVPTRSDGSETETRPSLYFFISSMTSGWIAGMIAGAERGKRKLFIACAAERFVEKVLDPLGAPLAVGPVDDAGLAEAAAADASAGHLDGHAVMDRLHERQNGPVGIGRGFYVSEMPSAAPLFSPAKAHKSRRALDRASRNFSPARVLLPQLDELVHGLLRFTDKKNIDEFGERLRVHGAGSAGDDHGMRCRSSARRKTGMPASSSPARILE